MGSKTRDYSFWLRNLITNIIITTIIITLSATRGFLIFIIARDALQLV